MTTESTVMAVENSDNATLVHLDSLDDLLEQEEVVVDNDDVSAIISMGEGEVYEEIVEEAEPEPEEVLAGSEPLGEPIEEDEVLADDMMREFDLALTISEAKDAVYSSAEAVEIITDPTTPNPAAVKVGRKRVASGTSRKAAVPRANRDIENIPAELFSLASEPGNFQYDELDAMKATFISGMPDIVKVREKIVTVMASLQSGAKLSPYIAIPIRLLMDRGVISSADIVAAYMATGNMSTGTARSQCTQMMTLLPYMQLATRSGKDLTFVSGTEIAKKIVPLI